MDRDVLFGLISFLVVLSLLVRWRVGFGSDLEDGFGDTHDVLREKRRKREELRGDKDHE